VNSNSTFPDFENYNSINQKKLFGKTTPYLYFLAKRKKSSPNI
jgi:hypothetical protein